MTLFELILALAVLGVAAPAAAQSVDRAAIWQANHGACVRILVTGKDASGNVVQPRNGSGVIVSSDGMLVTAMHVVGDDREWFTEPNGEVARRIEITALDEHDRPYALGQASVVPVPGRDVALLYVSAKRLAAAKVDARRPKALDSTVALLWGPHADLPEPVSADLVPTDRGKYGDALSLRLAVIEGYSGSGVFDANGRLVGVITNKLDESHALAVPTAAFKAQLPDEQPKPPSEEQVAACEARLRAQKADRQPFSAQNSVRCEGGGDQKSGIVPYNAPDGYTIIGQVSHRDETNYGAVGAVEYIHDGERVVSVRAAITCDTPNRPFGPGGWAGTALTGSIERIFSPEERKVMRETCLGELTGDDK